MVKHDITIEYFDKVKQIPMVTNAGKFKKAKLKTSCELTITNLLPVAATVLIPWAPDEFTGVTEKVFELGTSEPGNSTTFKYDKIRVGATITCRFMVYLNSSHEYVHAGSDPEVDIEGGGGEPVSKTKPKTGRSAGMISATKK